MLNKIKLITILISLLSFTACKGQSKTKTITDKTHKNNSLICDIKTGTCETKGTEIKDSKIISSKSKKLKVVYFTDPICSSCWGIEPQLRKLKLEYGEYITIEYRMGGLLPNWDYNSGGISKPSDVAHHWDEVSIHYDMPIDGDLWLEDPLESSYPPSIAYKAAQMQNKDKAYLFMRKIREMVFLKKINIAKWQHLATAAKTVKLNVKQLKTDYEGKAKALFEEDLKIAKEYGVKGFPTIYFVDNQGKKEMISGAKPYPLYEAAILKLNPTITKNEYSKNWETLFTKYSSLTAKEFSVLSGNSRKKSEDLLNELTENKKLNKITTKNGSMWIIKK